MLLIHHSQAARLRLRIGARLGYHDKQTNAFFESKRQEYQSLIDASISAQQEQDKRTAAINSLIDLHNSNLSVSRAEEQFAACSESQHTKNDKDTIDLEHLKQARTTAASRARKCMGNLTLACDNEEDKAEELAKALLTVVRDPKTAGPMLREMMKLLEVEEIGEEGGGKNVEGSEVSKTGTGSI